MRNKSIRTILLVIMAMMIVLGCGIFSLPGQIQEQLSTAIPEQLETWMPAPTEPETIQPQRQTTRKPQENLPPLPAAGDTIAPGTLEALYARVNPGVVSIVFTAQTSMGTGSGQGTGFVIDKEGHIVTNYHVAGEAHDMEVHFPSGLKVPAKLVGVDTDSDLAVIKVDVAPEKLTVLPIGDSDLAVVGTSVVAIGNPFGLAGTMTLGIISARGRTLPSIRTTESGAAFTAGELIQTDALINPGNSGGPLLNLNGEVIGVNRAIETAGTSMTGEAVNTGIGFAISSNILRKVVPSLIANGSYDYPYLGMSAMTDISLATADVLDLSQAIGAYVTSVVPGGPADRAGIRGGDQPTQYQGLVKGGDLIIAVDGQPIKDFSELMSYMMLNKNPGDVITFTVLRGTTEKDIDITLGSRP
ncbi:MAG: PDZ domain-containing protein [Chloroflexi bacterium]|nr:PDZ domain-containing protein [Chloroflexota bacterium]